jgi:hypothetical protein
MTMAARGSKARKKDKRRRHAKARKTDREQMPAFTPAPPRRAQTGRNS